MLFYGTTFLIGASLAALFMFLDVGNLSSNKEDTTKQVIATNSKPEYIDKSAYILSLKKIQKYNHHLKIKIINFLNIVS